MNQFFLFIPRLFSFHTHCSWYARPVRGVIIAAAFAHFSWEPIHTFSHWLQIGMRIFVNTILSVAESCPSNETRRCFY